MIQGAFDRLDRLIERNERLLALPDLPPDVRQEVTTIQEELRLMRAQLETVVLQTFSHETQNKDVSSVSKSP